MLFFILKCFYLLFIIIIIMHKVWKEAKFDFQVTDLFAGLESMSHISSCHKRAIVTPYMLLTCGILVRSHLINN